MFVTRFVLLGIFVLSATAQSDGRSDGERFELELSAEPKLLRHAADADAVAADIARFDARDKTFKATFESVERVSVADIFRVEFPSSLPIGDAAVDRGQAYFFRPRSGDSTRRYPAFVILHHLRDDIAIERSLAIRLAQQDVASMILVFPGYGSRKSESFSRDGLISADLEKMSAALIQGTADVRRAHNILTHLPTVDPERVGVIGLSLGALIASLTAGIDLDIDPICLVMGGGDLAKIMRTPSRETKTIRRLLDEAKVDDESLRRGLRAVEPLTYVHRIDGRRLLSFAAEKDQVILPEVTKAFLDRIDGEDAHVWPGDHVTMPMTHFGDIVKKAVERLNEAPERRRASAKAKVPVGADSRPSDRSEKKGGNE